MRNEILGLINMQEDNPLRELNEKRPLATMPFGGKFRLIDFTLSSMVNAGINDIGLLLSFSPGLSSTISAPLRIGTWPVRVMTVCSTCRLRWVMSSVPKKGISVHFTGTSCSSTVACAAICC